MRKRMAFTRAPTGVIAQGWAVTHMVQHSPIGASVGVSQVCAPQGVVCKRASSQGGTEGALGAEHTENAKGCVMLQALLLCGPDSRATMSRYDRAGFRSTAWHRLWRVVHTEQEGARTVARWSEQCVLYT